MTLRTETRPKQARRKRSRLRRLVARPLRWLAYALAGVILWVGAYTIVPPPGGYYMAAEWWRLGGIERDWVGMDAIPPHLARAVMAAEDARFCGHRGFDLVEIEKAIAERGRGRVRGASTISQQVAKNVFLWHDASWLRKGLEAGFTVMIEAIWTKRRILEVYLNVAEFGEGVFGAEAAARHYWAKPAAELTLGEAARLAAVLPDPKHRDPRRGSDFMNRRAAAIAGGARTLEGEGRAACVVRADE
ncbi:MAG TPA: monofunctional biosynthetic peptidoglycan transglycosylase [Thermohalobaculum sp.]|nr:monofunctional biosynthetic peptidoglycan transglycosylase [Thermohalobaculum sp.]